MVNFNFHLSTDIHFGRDALRDLPQAILQYGRRVFFLYDEIPAKVTGAYNLIHTMCEENGIMITEFTGIEPAIGSDRYTEIAFIVGQRGVENIVR